MWTIIMYSLNKKERKLLELQFTQITPPPLGIGQKMSKFNNPQKWRKGREMFNLQYVNNHYTKFE